MLTPRWAIDVDTQLYPLDARLSLALATSPTADVLPPNSEPRADMLGTWLASHARCLAGALHHAVSTPSLDLHETTLRGHFR